MQDGWKRFKPKFLEHSEQTSGTNKSLFNFRRLWKQSIVITLAVVLLPLFTLAVVDYTVSWKALESELLLRTTRLVSNLRRSLTSYLDERIFALNFLILDNSYAQLADENRLKQILENLKSGLGEWYDLGLIDHTGKQVNYTGPYNIQGMDYSGQDWYKKLHYKDQETYHDSIAMRSDVSDVFLGFRKTPHLVISVLHNDAQGRHYILRAGLDIEQLNAILSHFELSNNGDAFLINQEGIIQTSTRYYGPIMGKFPLPVPPFSERTQVIEGQDHVGREIVTGYAYITGTPFILVVVKQKDTLMGTWEATGGSLLLFLIGSVVAIVAVVFGICTYLVNSIYQADQKRLASLHQAEYANKMASIGRLSAGVAHEINNPLAIINEKAGLIKDLFTFRKEYEGDQRLLGLVSAIISSVDRCATITRQLLNFARNLQVNVQKLSLRRVVDDVLEFQIKEASHRHIAIAVDIPAEIPEFFSDRGKLQQVFINLVNNAFAAMKEGGTLAIKSRLTDDGAAIVTTVRDSGCGIPPEHLEKIFEPFFTTKSGSGGTGLGLSITYGLVTELGGLIDIKSTVGAGTTFIITLPLKYHADKADKGDTHEGTVG
ncbi:MAG: two-component sensor histidine kinase [Desulfobulbus sp.]|jgi:signal transduction histidine kinase|uniref:sensor histidine kinase n=1 Tax=Desulfobulbus sp. TaxID=895 RepID=UPI00284A1615|nr:ATP-binding protein [Desulfobulbus sp.]MDR2551148.1 two-component sensor histidine kinase [Desulfobulbus sp.]